MKKWKALFEEWEVADTVVACSIYVFFFIYFILVLEKWLLSLLLALVGLLLVPHLKNKRKKEKEKKLLLEFQDFLYGFTNYMGTGKSLENSVSKGRMDIETIYGDYSLLTSYLRKIEDQFKRGQGIDKGFIDLGRIYENKVIETFGEMIAIGRDKGGDLISVLKRTGEVLREQMEVELELETLLAKQQLEIKILRGMPFVLIVLLKLIYSEMISLLTGSMLGVVILLGAICLIGAAYIYSNKLMGVIW